jgi:thiol-disulfide isomerase/thioredoxin
MLDQSSSSKFHFLCLIVFSLAISGATVGVEPPPDWVILVQSGKAEAPPTAGANGEPDDDSIVIVEGQITSATGQGLEGATVAVYRAEEYPDGESLAEGRTDSFGDFKVRHAGAISGKLIVKITKRQYADHEERVEVVPGQAAPFVGVTLRGALSLKGRVVDATTKEPVGGAAVRFQSVGNDRFVTADDEGRFSVDSLGPGEGRLMISAEGYGRTIERIPAVEEAGVVSVGLKPERRVTINLVNDDDEPVFGAAIEALDRSHDDFRSVVTNEDGRAVLDGLNFDTSVLELRLWHSDHVSSPDFDRRITLPEADPHSEHTLVMLRAARITGRVLDGRTQRPLHGARVMVGPEYDEGNPRAWSNEEGWYVLDGVAPGVATITVHMRDFSPQLKRAELRAGKTQRTDFALRPPVRVTGVVRGADRQPIEGAEIQTMRWQGELTLGLRAMTDAEGRFTINDSPFEEYDIVILAPEHHIFTKTINPVSGPFEFILQPLPEESSSGRLNPGDEAPVVTMTTLKDERLNLAELRGRVVVIDFWATWCPPCVDEMKYLSRLFDKYRNRKDFALISVSRDFDEKALRRFLDERGPYARWHHVFGEERGGEEATRVFGVSAVPRLFIIGRDGKLIDRDLRGERLMARMDEIMGESETGD